MVLIRSFMPIGFLIKHSSSCRSYDYDPEKFILKNRTKTTNTLCKTLPATQRGSHKIANTLFPAQSLSWGPSAIGDTSSESFYIEVNGFILFRKSRDRS